MKFVNMTPHVIVYLHDDGTEEVFEPSGNVIRVDTVPGFPEEDLAGFQVFGPDETGEVVVHKVGRPIPAWPLPPFNTSITYIVSGMVGGACKRPDFVCPGTSDADNPRRNEKGHITGIRRFKRP